MQSDKHLKTLIIIIMKRYRFSEHHSISGANEQKILDWILLQPYNAVYPNAYQCIYLRIFAMIGNKFPQSDTSDGCISSEWI